MELSYFLAQLMGLSITIFAVLGIIRPKIVSGAIKTFESDSLMSLWFGFMGIVVSLAIVLSHNIWEVSWVGLITLFGWMGIIKGSVYLVSPGTLLNFGTSIYKNDNSIRMVLIGALIVGAYLAYKGFGN